MENHAKMVKTSQGTANRADRNIRKVEFEEIYFGS